MRIVFIGAGRLASNVAPSLKQAGHNILQVYSRTLTSAENLAAEVGAEAITDLSDVKGGADVYIFAVTDSSLPALAEGVGASLRRQNVAADSYAFLHTAGSVSMSVFTDCAAHYGVFYPMQTFSKGRRVSLFEVPFFIEGNDDHTMQTAQSLAQTVSSKVYALSSEGRKHLHLAAVFACNFANHCYQLSAELLEKHHIPFEVMLPLIDETAAKVHSLPPVEAQTGPAVRFDRGVMQAQLQLLADSDFHARIYDLMSQSIHHSYQETLQHD